METIDDSEIERILNQEHLQGKTLTGFTYHDEEDGKEKVGFVGIFNNEYYYLKQNKGRGEYWIKCKPDDVEKFKREMSVAPPQHKLL